MDVHVAMTERTGQKADAEVFSEEIVVNEITPASKAIETATIPEKIEEPEIKYKYY